MPILTDLAGQLANIVETPLSDPDRDVLSLHLLDTVGATLTGAATTDAQSAFRFLSGGGSVDHAAANCTATRMSEIDDIHLPSGCTPGSIIVPTALTMSAYLKVHDPDRVSAALVAGYEAMTRLAASVDGQNIVYKGIWTTYLTAPFGAAAVTAALLDLDDERTAHALSIALTSLAGRIGQPGNVRTSRWLMVGQAARAGCFAALAAADGFRGDLELLDGEWMATAHGLQCDPQHFSKASRSPMVVHDISMKPYCSAKQMVAAIAGFEEILGRGVRPDGIDAVIVSVPERYAKMIDHGVVEGNRLSSATSAPYQLSLAAYHKPGLFDVARSSYVLTEDITTLMEMVHVEVDAELGAHLPDRWPARVRVEAGSRSEVATVIEAPGDPRRRFTAEETSAKFTNFTSLVLDAAEVDDWKSLSASALGSAGALKRLQKKYLSIWAA